MLRSFPWERRYPYWLQPAVAVLPVRNISYYFCDHLGSTAYTINGTTEVAEVRHRPWGQNRFVFGSTPTTYRFTGQREESSIGLYYYGARWYDPALGRFIQPDSLVPNLVDPQAFDRYAYVLNNPMRYNDPTGNCGVDRVAGPTLVADTCGGGGGFAYAARATIQLAVDGTGAIVAGVTVANAVQGHRESVELPQQTKPDVSTIPLVDTLSGINDTTSVPDVPSQQIFWDPLPTTELGSNIVYSRNTLRRNMGITDPNMDAHHIIPYDLRAHRLIKLARGAGWSINAAYNGIELPNNDIVGIEMGLIYHSGSHKQYNDDVEDILDEWYTVARDKQWDSVDAAHALLGIIQGLRYTIENTRSRRMD